MATISSRPDQPGRVVETYLSGRFVGAHVEGADPVTGLDIERYVRHDRPDLQEHSRRTVRRALARRLSVLHGLQDSF